MLILIDHCRLIHVSFRWSLQIRLQVASSVQLIYLVVHLMTSSFNHMEFSVYSQRGIMIVTLFTRFPVASLSNSNTSHIMYLVDLTSSSLSTALYHFNRYYIHFARNKAKTSFILILFLVRAFT